MREKYSNVIKDKEGWKEKSVKEFFRIYKAELTESLKEYPKVKLSENVVMLSNLSNKEMPFIKELAMADFLGNIVNKEVIMLPRYLDSYIKNIFGVELQLGSLGEGFAALIQGDTYFEFKACNSDNVEKRLNEAGKKEPDHIGFIAFFNKENSNKNIISRFSRGFVQLPNISIGYQSYLLNLDDNKLYLFKKISDSKNGIAITAQNMVLDFRLEQALSTLKEYSGKESSVKAFERLSMSEYEKFESRDMLFQKASEIQIEELKEKYSKVVSTPAEWQGKKVRDFFQRYKLQITQVLKEYPKVEISNGTLMLSGLKNSEMPFIKEIQMAKILNFIVNIPVIVLPRYIQRQLNNSFGINLKEGSLGDGFAALSKEGTYYEFKACSSDKLVTRINDASLNDLNCVGFFAFYDKDNKKVNTIKKLTSKNCQLVNVSIGYKAFLLDIDTGNIYNFKKISDSQNEVTLVTQIRDLGIDLEETLDMLREYSGKESSVKAFERLSMSEYEKFESRDMLFQKASEIQIEELKEKYSKVVSTPAEWQGKKVRDFFQRYKLQITQVLKEYPKVDVDGILMLEGMHELDYPYQKELITAQITKELIGSEVILLPRFANNLIEKVFSINLNKGSFADGLAALVSGDKFLEFKLCGWSNFVQNLNDAFSISDSVIIGIEGIRLGYNEKKLIKQFEKRLTNLKHSIENKWIIALDLDNNRVIKKEGPKQSSLVSSGERISISGLEQPIALTSNKIYQSGSKSVNNYSISELLSTLSKVDKNALINKEQYFNANSTDMLFQKAYHGSGHNFNKFDISKIGSGEGAQYFGWGLYFSESEKIARAYAKRLGISKKDIDSDIRYYKYKINGLKEEKAECEEKLEKFSADEYWDNNEEYQYLLNGHIPSDFEKRKWDSWYGEGKWTLKSVAESIRREKIYFAQTKLDDINDYIRDYEIKLKELENTIAGHNLYTVNIPDGEYLKWDEPVSNTLVNKIVNSLDFEDDFERESFKADVEIYKGSGASMYELLSKHFSSDKEASEFLQDIGIKGISYPANSLSGRPSKTRNFVVFNDEDIEIENKILFQKQTTNQEILKAKEKLLEDFNNKYKKDMVQDTECKDLYIHKTRFEKAETSKNNKVSFDKEILSARNLANTFGIEVYLLPEFKNTDQLGLILNKNPDGIIEGKILELKQSESGTRSSVDFLLKGAIEQFAEIISLNIANKNVSLAEVEEYVYRHLNGRKEKFKDATVLVSIDNSPNFSIYSFKNNTLQKESTIDGARIKGSHPRPTEIPYINSKVIQKNESVNTRGLQLSWEAAPSRPSNILKDYFEASEEVQKKYTDGWTKEVFRENGKNILFDSLGFKYKEDIDSRGWYAGEANYGIQTVCEVPLDENYAPTEEAHEKLNGLCRVLGFLLSQDAVPWNFEGVTTNKEEENGLKLTIGRVLNLEEKKLLVEAIDEISPTYGFEEGEVGLIAHKEGEYIVNFAFNEEGDLRIPNLIFQEMARKIVDKFDSSLKDKFKKTTFLPKL